MDKFTALILVLSISLFSGCIGDSSDQEIMTGMQVEQLQVIDITQGENGSSPGVLCFNIEYCNYLTYYEFENDVFFSDYSQVSIYSMETHTSSVADDMIVSISCAGCRWIEKSMSPIYFEDRAYFIGGEENLWMHNFSTSTSILVYDLSELGEGYRPLAGNAKSPGKYLSVIVDEKWFFSSDSAEFGLELWSFNLETHELSLVIDTAPGTFETTEEYPQDGNPGKHFSMVVDDRLMFSSFNGSEHTLWIHDTTNSSTWEVPQVIWGHQAGSSRDILQEPILVNDIIYFSQMANLIAYDTIDESVTLVVGHLENIGLTFFEFQDGVLYFDARPITTLDDRKLWAHNISNSTTWLIDDEGIAPVSLSSTWNNGTVYYTTFLNDYGRELMAYNSVNATSWIVSDINPGRDSSDPEFLAMSDGGILYFSADDGGTGRELWAHNLQNSTTWLFSDINPGSDGSNPGKINSASSVFETDNSLFFAAYNVEYGLELWRLIL